MNIANITIIMQISGCAFKGSIQQALMATMNSIILLLVLSISQCMSMLNKRDVYIQLSEGEHCPGTYCYNITTFGKMADSFSNSSGLVVHFLKGTHLLDLQKLVVFTNLTNAVFEGDERMEQGFHETVWQSTVVIKCTEHSSTGIAFVNSSNITFRYITITNCGAAMLDNTVFIKLVGLISTNASLWYHSVGNIAIDHASVQNGSGSGLQIITEGADLSITTSSFARNGVQGDIVANVIIVYTDPLNCDPQIYNTLITNTNISHLPFHSSTISSFGLYMVIIQSSYSVTIVLDSVIVYRNNGLGNIVIGSINVPNYNLIINNSHISDTIMDLVWT